MTQISAQRWTTQLPLYLPEVAAMMQAWRDRLDCRFTEVDAIFEECMQEAQQLSKAGLDAYLDSARALGKLGRGAEPVLTFLQIWPQTASTVGEDALEAVMASVLVINKSPNGRAIAPLLQSLHAVSRRLLSSASLQQYLHLGLHILEQTSGSIHGIHKTYASPCLIAFFEHAPQLLQLLSIEGMSAWAEYGIRHYRHHPEQQQQYFSLQSADSRAVLQRERHGTLLADHLRMLDLHLRALWQDPLPLVAYATTSRSPNRQHAELQPYYDEDGIRLPDVYDARNGVSGLDRYRVALAHMAAHRHWSRAIFADNFSPAQRLAVETFEDARIDLLVMRLYPGLRPVLMALHPVPRVDACNPQTHSCLRHRLAMLSRALLCGADMTGQAIEHEYTDAMLLAFGERFHAALAEGESSTDEMAALAIAYLAKTRCQSDQLPTTWFTDTVVDYRDDNRTFWKFHELSDDEENFASHRPQLDTQQLQRLPPRHYPEWDYSSQSYRPDWVSVFESLHPASNSANIDQLLAKHSALVKRLKRMLDLLKPHARVRLRHQEDASELDLDMAVSALIDLKANGQPESRITESHRTDGRSIAVTLLLDLSESLNDKAAGSQQSILELSQEAVSLLAWTIEQLGDPLAIAGFHSNTRHDVRYMHLKGFGEHWGTDVKSRLAAMQAAYSTRMGAAMRHAAHTLAAQQAGMRLLLVLTDGRPSDVDVHDEQLLTMDARQAVKELKTQGITSYCVSLDAQADGYVREIFGGNYAVVDRIATLPEKLPKLFMKLTK
jgi:hypothetical protein